MDLAYSLLRPLLFSMDAEEAHTFTLRAAGLISGSPALCNLARSLYAPPDDPALAVEAFGLRFSCPVGLAAGLDKNGEAIDFWSALGFGFVELGTVTPKNGQPGNDKPRLQRLIPDRAIVNRMGFNNLGAAHLASRLAAARTSLPLGANIGKAKVTPLSAAADDYEEALTAVWPNATYIAVNVSSPNTPGLRDLQAISSLEPLIARVQTVNRDLAARAEIDPKPILLKIAPDLADEDVDRIAQMALDRGLDGLIATNTTLNKSGLQERPTIEGGLSGEPLKARALELTKRLYGALQGAIPIVGVGGVGSAEDAYQRLRAGASLVQVYTAFVYQGPGLVKEIVAGLKDRLNRDGFGSIQDVIGVDACSSIPKTKSSR